MEACYRDSLRSSHTLLCNTLDLKTSGVLDKLEEDGVISSNEAEEIMSNKVRKTQNCKFLYFLKRKDSSRKPYQSFLHALSGKYDFLVERLNADSKHTSISEPNDISCIYCNLINILNPCDLSHELFERKAFSDDALNEVNDKAIPQSERAKKLLYLISDCKQNETVNTFVWLYFREKYKNVILRANSLSDITLCKCTKTILSKSKSVQIYKKQSNKAIETFMASTTTAITPRSSVRKYLPNNNKLMRQCNHVWKTLWVLREAGDWNKYDQLMAKALNTYDDNPDMQVILYRHGMARSAFYNEDYSEACRLYEMAMDVLPKANMANWHNCRIFGLKSLICAREGQFGEAHEYLTKAHHAAEFVAPCFATGTVYFYEGIYLSHLLRCSHSGLSARSIFERAKESYRKSIDHYKQEPFFAVQSLLNEVYLFLALLELQVDFKTCKSIRLLRNSSINLSMVEYYLNLFENTCWSGSTRWAKMMFFVARAELHNLRDNIQRSVDYLDEAKSHAVIGKFEDYKTCIERNLSTLQERLNQQPKIFEIDDFSDSELESYLPSIGNKEKVFLDTSGDKIRKRKLPECTGNIVKMPVYVSQSTKQNMLKKFMWGQRFIISKVERF